VSKKEEGGYAQIANKKKANTIGKNEGVKNSTSRNKIESENGKIRKSTTMMPVFSPVKNPN
jgi:hypothetical protein